METYDSVDKIKEYLNTSFSFFGFTYKNKNCGIEPYSNTNYDVWCGDDFANVDSIDKIFEIEIFCGKKLKDILNDIDPWQ